MKFADSEWMARKNAELNRLILGNGWEANHRLAWDFPSEVEKPIVGAIQSWYGMLEQHGLDYVNRDSWAAMGEALRTYLNYDWGQRLDMGTLDKIICELLEKEGYDPDMSEWKGGENE